ncbi:hypothetical protein E4M16_03660 [Ligilactobacillus ruminis]|nr:hypothetical protein E4M16_03660 [Ligilactobacillus ruminis]
MDDHTDLLYKSICRERNAIKALKGRIAFVFLHRHPEIRRPQSRSGHLWSPGCYMSTSGK